MPMYLIRRVICPFCLEDIRTWKRVPRCPVCQRELPTMYLVEHQENPPIFVQGFGWSQHGKTVFISALTLMLAKMANVWPRFAASAATDASQRKIQEVRQFQTDGVMPPITQLGPQDVYIMILRSMERWGGRTLVTRDCAGEIFDSMEVPIEQAPFLRKAPTTLMLISLSDLPTSRGRSMDMLINNYVNTLMKYGVDFGKHQRNVVVTLTKADLISNLPGTLRNYLIDDPLWAAVHAPNSPQLDATAMEQYIQTLVRVNDEIKDWVQQDSSGRTLVRLGDYYNIDLRFCLVSSLGTLPFGNEPITISPRRVLDPLFWALELETQHLAGIQQQPAGKRRLRVFLSYASEDTQEVRNIHRRLMSCGIDAWLADINLLPGQDWESEVRQAVRLSDVVIVCLTHASTAKSGFVQKEIKLALDIADEQPPNTIFLIPVKLDDCRVPETLKRQQWINLQGEADWEKLLRSLRARAGDVGAIVN